MSGNFDRTGGGSAELRPPNWEKKSGGMPWILKPDPFPGGNRIGSFGGQGEVIGLSGKGGEEFAGGVDSGVESDMPQTRSIGK